MRGGVVVVAVVVVAACLMTVREARAQSAALPAEPQLALLDSDAALYLTFTPDAEVALSVWARRTPGLQRLVDVAAARSLRRLGFDVTTTWAESGLASEVPVVAGLFAVDVEATEKAFHARADKLNDARALARAPRAWNRSRAVALVRDEKKLRTALAALAASGTELVLAGGPATGVASVFRADAKLGKGIAAALTRARVLAVARLSTPQGHDVLVFVRVLDRRWLVVDALWAFGGVPVDWKVDGAPLLRLVARNVGKEHVGTGVDVHTLPGTALGNAGAALMVQPERLIEVGKFIGWSKALQAASGVADASTARSVLDTAEREVAACEDFRPIATDGPLASFVVAATRTAAGVDVDAYWALRAPGVLDAAFATNDDGLVDLAAASGTKLIALLPLAGTEGLRKLPRPGALAQDRHAIDERARLCGAAGTAQVLLLGWPQYLTLFMDSDASTNELFPWLHNLAFAVKSYGARPGQTQMVMIASVERPVLHDDLDRVLKRGNATAGKRKLTVWKSKQPEEPWAVATPSADGKRTIYGLAWGGDPTLTWWWGQPSPASAGGAMPFVALLHTDLPWFAESVLTPELGLPGLAEPAKNLGGLNAVLTLEPQVLHLHASIGVR